MPATCVAKRSCSDSSSSSLARRAMRPRSSRVKLWDIRRDAITNELRVASRGRGEGMAIRAAAVAGTWYPGSAGALTREVDDYLGAVTGGPAGRLHAIIAPHAGLMFSGPIAAHAYKTAAAGQFDVAVLVGPSHFVGFEG